MHRISDNLPSLKIIQKLVNRSKTGFRGFANGIIFWTVKSYGLQNMFLFGNHPRTGY